MDLESSLWYILSRNRRFGGRGDDHRNYEPSDCKYLAALFNARDYSENQLQVWATGHVDLEQWNRSFLDHITLVAVQDGDITGFGDMDPTGYLDRLYVHSSYQRQGIATAICDRLEQAVQGQTITTHASITAKPLFSAQGDTGSLREQQVIRGGIALTNYVMEKEAAGNLPGGDLVFPCGTKATGAPDGLVQLFHDLRLGASTGTTRSCATRSPSQTVWGWEP